MKTITKIAVGDLQTWMLATLLGLATLVLYWPATHNAFINFDDSFYVSGNPHVQAGLTWESTKWAFSHPVSGNWHPVTMLSHMLDCQVFGMQPWGHHLTSLWLHALNTVLVFALLRRLTGALWRSAAVAAVFAGHPLHVESVAWVAERKDVLSACFGFLALLLYVRYAHQPQPGNEGPAADRRTGTPACYRSLSYWLAWLCFALGLMCKPMLVTWPFVLVLLDYWPLERFQPGRGWRLVLEKVPFVALATAASMVALAMQQQEGAVRGLESLPLEMRAGNVLVSYCRYLGKMLWPADLAVFYPHPGNWPLRLELLAGVFLACLSTIVWVKRRRHPFLLVGWLWFIGTLVPVIGWVQVGIQSMADRYTYIPSVGLLVLIVWGAYELSRAWPHQSVLLGLAGSSAILLCLALTRQQIGYWKDSETLFRHALAVSDDNCTARNSLGNALLDQGRTEAAIDQFQAGLRLDPNYPPALDSLGNALAKQGETDAAINQYQQALRLNPDYAEAHNNLGNALGKQGRTDAAISEYQAALRLNPDGAEAHYNLGNLLARTGQTDAAISQYQAALGLNPRYAEAYNNLGILVARNGQTAAAISLYQAALRFKPDYADAHYNLGNALLKGGQIDASISQLQEVIRLLPEFAPAHYSLGVGLSRNGRADEAMAQFQETIRLKPDDAVAHDKLGILLGEHGRLADAISQFQAALHLKPDYAEASNNLARALEMQSAPKDR